MWSDMADDKAKGLRGPTGFHFFYTTQMKQFRIDYPPTTTSGHEIRQMITNKWHEMTDDDKKHWLESTEERNCVMRESLDKLNNEDSLAWIDATLAHPDNPKHNASTRPRRKVAKIDSSNADGDATDDNEDWVLTKIYNVEELNRAKPTMCSNDKCDRVACSRWETVESGKPWNLVS